MLLFSVRSSGTLAQVRRGANISRWNRFDRLRLYSWSTLCQLHVRYCRQPRDCGYLSTPGSAGCSVLRCLFVLIGRDGVILRTLLQLVPLPTTKLSLLLLPSKSQLLVVTPPSLSSLALSLPEPLAIPLRPATLVTTLTTLKDVSSHRTFW